LRAVFFALAFLRVALAADLLALAVTWVPCGSARLGRWVRSYPLRVALLPGGGYCRVDCVSRLAQVVGPVCR
jgi:hypothetical protein